MPDELAPIRYQFGDNTQIHADVFGGVKWETHVYLLRAAAGQVDWRAYRDQRRAPYRFLDSYGLMDAAIYAGRQADLDRLEGEVLAYRLVILQGPIGAGKTSLLQAGLVPRLMARGYLTLLACDYVHPATGLINALAAAREQLAVDLNGVTDLAGLTAATQRDLNRPTVLILDHFERFFTDPDLTSADRERFRAELAHFRAAEFGLPACLLISIRQQSHGELAFFQGPADNPAVPDIYHHVVVLDLLTVADARAAALAPLAGLEPPMVFDTHFLDSRLLPDLTLPGRGEHCIDPPHLQIVCKVLYDAARQRGRQVINERLYEELGGRTGILGGYLGRALSEEFPDPAHYELARTLLKMMVTAGGEPTFVSPVEAARRSGRPLAEVSQVVETLQRRSLLASRAERAFSVAHPTMAQAVLRWFDPAEAERRAAEDALEHGWNDWLAWLRLRSQPGNIQHPPPLLDRARLRQIAPGLDRLAMTPGMRGLLLRSAVVASLDLAVWWRALADDAEARHLLEALQRGGPADQIDPQALQLGQVLGVVPPAATGRPATDAGDMAPAIPPNPLGRAALAAESAEARHTAALALASLGPTAVAGHLLAGPPAGSATPSDGRYLLSDTWRRAEALAWLQAANAALPELSSTALRIAAAIGGLVLRFQAGWQTVAIEAAGAALGGALAYAVRGALMQLLLVGLTPRVALLAFAASLASAALGAVLGGTMVLVARFLVPEARLSGRHGTSFRWAAAMTLGFALGLAVGIPAEAAYVSDLAPHLPRLLIRYLVGGPLQGLGLAVGLAWAQGMTARRQVAAAGIGAAAAGLVLGLLSWVTGFEWAPNLTHQGSPWPALAQAVLFGALTGAGLAGGWAWGHQAAQRLRDSLRA